MQVRDINLILIMYFEELQKQCMETAKLAVLPK